ncbi:MAG: DUF1844 domain-containing protein [Acidobacteriota bacterium]
MQTPKDSKPKELKVTDKRIFTPEGDIREEFRSDIKPADPQVARPVERPAETPAAHDRRETNAGPPPGGDRRRSMAERAESPGTPFAEFAQQLIAQAYMFLGMLRSPHSPKPVIDVAAARDMIEILTMLKEKTAGNLTPEEEDFLSTHLGELKLAFVQRTKTI